MGPRPALMTARHSFASLPPPCGTQPEPCLPHPPPLFPPPTTRSRNAARILFVSTCLRARHPAQALPTNKQSAFSSGFRHCRPASQPRPSLPPLPPAMRRFFYRIVNTTLEEGGGGRIAYTGWYLVSTVDIVLNISREGRGGWSPENNVVIRHFRQFRIAISRRPGNFCAYSQRENCFAYISYVHMRLITSFFFEIFQISKERKIDLFHPFKKIY